ncbi:MAG: ATP phosphoribosyltransferase regulatory subunit [Pseudomonadota bacterium]
MSKRHAVDREILRLVEAFQKAGGRLVDLPVLQPADTLLDLYGEDIRSRAYTTRDPVDGELMLRPDFTVPVVQMHMTSGATPARYAYCGKVFRTQELNSDRPPEYDQVGFEIFDADDPAAADAEVFVLLSSVLPSGSVRASTGDIGILMAAVKALFTSPERKAALMRHIWRPSRFRALLDRYSGRAQMSEARAALLERARRGEDLLADAGPVVGLRRPDEIRARLAVLSADAEAPPISTAETDLLDVIVTLKTSASDALARLREVAQDMPGISAAVARFEKRLDALSFRGVDTSALEFQGGYGRATMEYYDGFVFGFTSTGSPDLPPIATGGRYDALVKFLGGGASIPAVGGVVRPALSVALAP